MKILALDVGTKTVGIAISDDLGWTAQGLATLKVDENKALADTLQKIAEMVQAYNVEKVVVGLPKNMNGTIGPRGEACQQFAAKLKKYVSCPVVMWDERLSTVAAEKVLLSANVSRKKRKKVIDKMAAVVILQGYLDSVQK